MKRKITAIFVLTLLITSILTVSATEIEEKNSDQAPSTPIIEGPNEGEIGETCFYTAISTDPQDDDLYYVVRFSDDPSFKFRAGPYKSGEKITIPHCWDDFYQETNPFVVQVMTIDEYDHESNWGIFEVNMTNAKVGVVEINKYNNNLLINNLLLQFLENHPYFITLILKIIKPR